jgi:hypothetical protein
MMTEKRCERENNLLLLLLLLQEEDTMKKEFKPFRLTSRAP